ncbi:MAG: DNA-processing protein DprA [Anaerolineales bacterium]|nr:DNA-processing protein DprA [Anaerolineales bacterium]
MMEDRTKYWVGFNLVRGIGPVRLERLLQHFGDIQSAWEARSYQLAAAGLNENLSREMIRIRENTCLDELMETIQKAGIKVYYWDHPHYPERLRHITQSPFVIYLKGDLIENDIWGVAIVGTRRYSDYGRQITGELARMLAGYGITVISGLARGIDGIAHQGSLDAGGRTIAVLGNGLDIVYPPEHKKLAERIVNHGALISDYPIGTPPDGSNFPPRNRIISGLAKMVIVIEAGQKSGALITAGYAAEQGKEVFAVPGKITSPASKGTNLLIKQGAHPLLSAQDVLDLLNMSLISEQRTVQKTLPSDPREALLFQAVGDEPQHVDEISSQVNLPIEEVTSTLALMELKGMVRKTFGMKYVAVRDMMIDYRSRSNLNGEGS